MNNERTMAERAALRYASHDLAFDDPRVTGFLADPSVTNVSLVLVADEQEEIALLVRGSRVLGEFDADDFFRNGGRRLDGSYTNGTRTHGKAVWGAAR